MQNLSFSRRNFMALGGAGLVAALPMPSFALTGTQAETLVNSAVADINRVIASGASVNSMVNSFKGIFDRYADTAYLAAYALGNSGRSASAAQKRAFGDAFGVYLANKYGRRFNEFAGGQIQVQGSRSVNSYIEVRTLAILRGSSPFQVDFQVSDRPGRPVFFNLIIEGVKCFCPSVQRSARCLMRVAAILTPSSGTSADAPCRCPHPCAGPCGGNAV